MRFLSLRIDDLPVPVALYPLNGRHATRDIGRNKNPPGVPSDVHLAPGPYGLPQGSYQFSGSFSSYIEFPNNGGLDVRHSATVLFWVNRENEKGPIFAYGTNIWGFHIWFVISGNLYARTPNWPREDYGYHVSTPLLLSSWYYVGVTYDFSSGVGRLWVNGEAALEVRQVQNAFAILTIKMA